MFKDTFRGHTSMKWLFLGKNSCWFPEQKLNSRTCMAAHNYCTVWCTLLSVCLRGFGDSPHAWLVSSISSFLNWSIHTRRKGWNFKVNEVCSLLHMCLVPLNANRFCACFKKLRLLRLFKELWDFSLLGLNWKYETCYDVSCFLKGRAPA